MADYFTDREYGERPRTENRIDERVWDGLRALVETYAANGSFGYRFPEPCPDPYTAACGCDTQALGRLLVAEVPWIEWPLPASPVPDTPVILDVLEFCAAAVGEPVQGAFHSYYRHHHLTWNREVGLNRFVAEVNRIFARNGVGYELTPIGQARRVLPQPLANHLVWTLFSTGDAETDRLLETARCRIMSPKNEDRQDAVEKLWDAFERLKTLEPGKDKKVQANALLDRSAPSGSRLREVLADEAIALTKLGNSFRIRHAEVGKESLNTPEQIDYFFARMFAFVHMVLRATGRVR